MVRARKSKRVYVCGAKLDPSRFRQAISRKIWAEFRLSPDRRLQVFQKVTMGIVYFICVNLTQKALKSDQSFGE